MFNNNQLAFYSIPTFVKSVRGAVNHFNHFFGKIHFLLISEIEFFHEIKRDGIMWRNYIFAWNSWYVFISMSPCIATIYWIGLLCAEFGQPASDRAANESQLVKCSHGYTYNFRLALDRDKTCRRDQVNLRSNLHLITVYIDTHLHVAQVYMSPPFNPPSNPNPKKVALKFDSFRSPRNTLKLTVTFFLFFHNSAILDCLFSNSFSLIFLNICRVFQIIKPNFYILILDTYLVFCYKIKIWQSTFEEHWQSSQS